MSDQAKAVQVQRHTEIQENIISGLENAVSNLETLVNEIQGTKSGVGETAFDEETDPSLSDFLNNAASSIRNRTERITISIGTLHDMLL